MAEFAIKTFDEKIHNIYIKGDVDEDMWQALVDKINEIRNTLSRAEHMMKERKNNKTN